MAAALFNQLADPSVAAAISAGTDPAHQIHREVIEVMREMGLDLSEARPQRLTPQVAAGASLLVTMGCGEACPALPGLRVEEWQVEDPKGQPLERVRRIRDELNVRVQELIRVEGWGRQRGRRES